MPTYYQWVENNKTRTKVVLDRGYLTLDFIEDDNPPIQHVDSTTIVETTEWTDKNRLLFTSIGYKL